MERKIYTCLPPLFAEKDRNSLRKEGEGSINYQGLDIVKITQKIQMVGAETFAINLAFKILIRIAKEVHIESIEAIMKIIKG